MIPRLRPADVKRISLCLILLISLLSGSTITAQPGDKVFGVEHFALMNQLSVAEKRFPRSEHDIAADFFALRKYYTGTRWTFDEGRNTFNPASHCDIAWAGALASYAQPLSLKTAPSFTANRSSLRKTPRKTASAP